MKTVDWEKFASDHEMTRPEFVDEIFKCASILGTMYLDHHPESSTMSVSRDDTILTVFRLKPIARINNDDSATKN